MRGWFPANWPPESQPRNETGSPSGRTRHVVELVPVDGTAKTHTLRDCNGCDAPLALKLGAAQSFVGVVKRISRTEYQVRFQLRDARTGTHSSRRTSASRKVPMR